MNVWSVEDRARSLPKCPTETRDVGLSVEHFFELITLAGGQAGPSGPPTEEISLKILCRKPHVAQQVLFKIRGWAAAFRLLVPLSWASCIAFFELISFAGSQAGPPGPKYYVIVVLSPLGNWLKICFWHHDDQQCSMERKHLPSSGKSHFWK